MKIDQLPKPPKLWSLLIQKCDLQALHTCICHFKSEICLRLMLCTSHLKPPHPGHGQGEAGTITSYSSACVSLGGGVNARFHDFQFAHSFPQMALSRLKIRLTSSWMSRGFHI